MSSNIKVQRICQNCGSEFTARTTVTRFCGDDCAKKAYKARQRAVKIQESNKETQGIRIRPIEDILAKEFLTVRDVAILLNSSLRTVYRLIEQGNLKAFNISQRKTLVRRLDIDKLFQRPALIQSQSLLEIDNSQPNPLGSLEHFNISEYYTFDEIQNKYGISETDLQQLIRENGIFKIKIGWFEYVSKNSIEDLLNIKSYDSKG
jgi:excisionase family DNA binding protein